MPDEAGVSLEGLLTTSQAADRLGVCDSTVGRYKRLGWITPVKTFARSNLYRRADVDALHRRLHPHERNSRG